MLRVSYFALFAFYAILSPFLQLMLGDLGYSPVRIGLLLGINEAAGMMGPFVFGRLADRTRRDSLILIAVAVVSTAFLVPLAFSRNLLVTAVVLAAYAFCARSTIPLIDTQSSHLIEGTGKSYGSIRVFGSLGFIAISVAGQFLPIIDGKSPTSIALWLGGTALVFAATELFIPRRAVPKPHVENSASPFRNATGDSGSGAGIRLDAAFWIGIALIFLGRFGLVPSQSFLSIWVRDQLHWNAVSGVWALSAASEVPLMYLSGRLIKRFGSERLIAVSLSAILLRNLIYALMPNPAGVVLGQLLHSLCFGLFHPVSINFIVTRVPARARGLGMAIYAAVGTGLSTLMGNVLGGWVIEKAGFEALFWIFAIFPAVGLLGFIVLRKRLA